jgi:hypothetical protein
LSRYRIVIEFDADKVTLYALIRQLVVFLREAPDGVTLRVEQAD